MTGSIFFQLSPIPNNAVTGHYNLYLVALSYFIAVFASFGAFEIAAVVRQSPAKTYWWRILGGAFAMGAGIFSMHFVGMLSYHLSFLMNYDFLLTLISLIVPIAASVFALLLIKSTQVSNQRLIFGGIIFGLTIASMHYIGMAAMVDVEIHYLPSLFFVSILIAIIASITALWLMLRCDRGTIMQQRIFKAMSAFVMGTAICGMHYTGMAAAVIVPKETQTSAISFFHLMSSERLAFLIAFMTALIMIVMLTIISFRHLMFVKLLMGYMVLLLLFIPITFIVMESVNTLTRSFEKITLYSFPRIQSLLEMKNIVSQIQTMTTRFDLTEPKNKLAMRKNELLALFSELDKWQNQYEQHLDNKQKKPLVIEQLKTLKNNIILTAFALIEGKEESFPPEQLIQKREALDEAQKELADFIEAVIVKDINERKQIQDEMQRFITETFNLSLIALGTIILSSITISLFLSFQISKPIFQLRNSADEIAKGNLTKKIPITSEDEIGQLAKSFNIMVDALAESQKKRNEFLSIAAHDLRNPLSVIMVGSSLISTAIKEQKPEKQESIANMIHKASTSMLDLLNELLTVNTFESGGLIIRQKEVNLRNFGQGIFEFNLLLAKKKKINFMLDMQLQQENVYFDEDKIAQVINNFLSNAFKFSKPDSKVFLVIKENGKSLRVEVRDEAGGIPMEEQNKVFTKFARLSIRPTGDESTHGLGLAISKNIIQTSGGSIGFESTPGKGTTFYFEIDTQTPIVHS